MRKIIAILLIASFAFACRYSTQPSAEELKDHLKKVMTDYLYKGVNNDSSRVKFSITDVTYFINSTNYSCEFKVRMHQNNVDTVGMMTASISKDFKHVNRGF